MNKKWLAMLVAGVALSGCVPETFNPTLSVMPGPGKSLDLFAADQSACQQFAAGQIAGARQQANQNIANNVLLTNPPDPLATAQAESATATAALQQQYDAAYGQCMYAKGNQVPGYEVEQRAPVRRRVRARKPTKSAGTEEFVEPAPSTAPASNVIVEPPPTPK